MPQPVKYGKAGARTGSRDWIFAGAIDLLLALNAAKSVRDISPLKSVGLHKLKGERKEQWAMKVAHLLRVSQRGRP